MKYYLLLLFLMATIPSSLFSQQEKLPKYEMKRSIENSICSPASACDQTQMLSFGKLLAFMSAKADEGLNSELCNDEKMKQAKHSVDNMVDKDKQLNCCLMNRFCEKRQSNFEELYSVEWKSNNPFCGLQKVSFQIERQDCYTYSFL